MDGLIRRIRGKPASVEAALMTLIQGLYMSVFIYNNGDDLMLLEPVYKNLVFRGTQGIQTFGQKVHTDALDKLSIDPARCLRELTARVDVCPAHKAMAEAYIVATSQKRDIVSHLTLYGITPFGDFYPLGISLDLEAEDFVDEDNCAASPFYNWLRVCTKALARSVPGAELRAVWKDMITAVATPISSEGVLRINNRRLTTRAPLANIVNILLTSDRLCGSVRRGDDILRDVSTQRMISLGSDTLCVIGVDAARSVWSILQGKYIGENCPVSSALNRCLSDRAPVIYTNMGHLHLLAGRVFQGALESAKSGNLSGIPVWALEADAPEDLEPEKETATQPGSSPEGSNPEETEETISNGSLQGDDSSNSGDNKDNPMSDGEKHDDSMDLIPLDKSDESQNAYFYKLAVAALNTTLGKDSDLPVSAEHRNTLDDWCKSWLWTSTVTKTQELMQELGLQELLKTINPKGR